MSSFEVACHQELRNEMGTTTRTEGKLGLLQKFARLYQHPALLKYPDECSVEELLSQSSKLSQLINVLQRIQSRNEKAIIFCRHKDMQRVLARVLGAEFGRTIRIINGDTARVAPTRKVGVETRSGILEEFKRRKGFDTLILSPFVAGVGLTITEANHVIHYGRWWNPAVEAQATDRAYRIGQDKEVHAYFLINKDDSNTIGRTFDQLLDDLMERKKDVANRALGNEDFLLPQEDEQRAGMEVYAQLGQQL
jgi:SNF2 family DNA or RNA helicase